MAVRFHRKKKVAKDTHLNISKSGLSVSKKAGRFTFNSRGTVSYNSSVKGLSFRMPTIPAVLFFIPSYYIIKGSWWLFKLPFRATWFILKLPFKLLKKKKEE